MEIHVVFFFLILINYQVKGWPCKSTIRKVYRRVNTDAVLQFTADLRDIEGSRKFDVVFYDGSPKARIRYFPDKSFTVESANGVHITGDTVGNVSVTLENVQQNSFGIYAMTSTGLETRCNCLYILGIPTKPTIMVNEVPSAGGSATLPCSSTSTTTPSNHSLSLTYNWRVDNVDNPNGSRYSYSNNRNTLRLSSIVKDDVNKQFTCAATEVVTDGYTSSNSESFSFDVHYGPENLIFSPNDTSYQKAENTNLNPVTCTAGCMPICSFKWTKIGQPAFVENTAVLRLGQLTSSEAGVYTCTATRSRAFSETKNLTINVIYGPRGMFFIPNNTSYRQDQNYDLPPVTCSAECWDCSYSWKGPNSYSSPGPVLDLGGLTRTMAGEYTCTATNTKSQQAQKSKVVQIEVRYGPESISLTPGNLSYTVDEGSTLRSIECFADCFPTCTYKWTKERQPAAVSNTDTLPLGQIQKSYAGKYTCRATNGDTPSRWFDKHVTINVRYGPYPYSTILSPATQEYILNENTTLLGINCSADCYPDCIYAWTKTQGKNTTVSRTGVLSLGTLDRDDAATYICTALNPGKSISPTTTIQVTIKIQYGPDAANINVQSPYSVTEGDTNINIECSSDCFPRCSYRWINLTSGSNISTNHVLSLQLVNRYMDGGYKCISSNTVTQNTSASTITVIVEYAPDVRMQLSTNNTTEGKNLTLFCHGDGVPSTYNYISFIQTWNNIEIPNSNTALDGTQRYSSIHFSSLKLEDTGTYTCLLNNGIVNAFGDLNQSGAADILVEVSPKDFTDELRFTGSIGGSAQIQVSIYSYPTLESSFVTRYDGEVISPDRINIREHEVRTMFYSKPVTLNGSKLDFIVQNLEEKDFGNYTFQLTNRLGITYVYAFLKAEGKPLPPKDFEFLSGYGIPTFLWQKDFNGGPDQSFVIQTSVAGTGLWTNHTDIKENDKQYLINSTFYMANITGLDPGIYTARIFASNTEGDSEIVNLGTTFEVLRQKAVQITSPPIGAIAGGSASVVVVIVFVTLVLVILRRRARKKDGSQTKLDTRSCHDEDDDADEVNTVNPMYISADEVQPSDNTYAQPKKKKASEVSDVYAMVDKKTKTGKKGNMNKKCKNTSDGDIYENAADVSLEKNKMNKNNKGKAYEENPYENPDFDSTKQSKKLVNKDGLIYADLAFNEQPKGQKKLVIHGLDSMTEYVEVDFTKKADPLPDSDEEDNRKET